MKKMLYIIILLFSIFNIAQSFTLKIEDSYRYSLTVTDTTGNHKTSLTILLSIQRGDDGLWFDFNDTSFKSSGWTTKTVNLTEDVTNENYYYLWEDQGGDTIGNHYIFHAKSSGRFINQETVSFQDFIDTATINNIEINTNGIKDNGIYNGVEPLIIANGGN